MILTEKSITWTRDALLMRESLVWIEWVPVSAPETIVTSFS
jgi:hypothetical protein